MKYDKKVLSFEQQADLLIGRGLIADRDQLIKRLKSTSYYRLSGYLYPSRITGTDQLQPDTSLEKVWNHCLFDQRLRTLILDAIEAIEVFTRTQLAYHFAHNHGAFEYTTASSLPNLDQAKFSHWVKRLDDQVQRSLRAKEEFLVHFFKLYGDEHTRPPIWMQIELMDFGSTLTFYRGVDVSIQQAIAKDLFIPDKVFLSWLLSLNTVRNRCAHHLRLWDWAMGIKVSLPRARKYPEWHSPPLSNQNIGVILFICRHLLNKISPHHQWTERVNRHFTDFPNIDLSQMGLPENWQSHPLWKQK